MSYFYFYLRKYTIKLLSTWLGDLAAVYLNKEEYNLALNRPGFLEASTAGGGGGRRNPPPV